VSIYLALDAATAQASVALGRPGGAPVERVLGGETRHHAAHLLPALRELFTEAGVTPLDLAGVVVGDGPGSFTGLRVAGALAKGLLHGSPSPLFVVPSLYGCGWRIARAEGTGPVAALYDALRGEVFVSVWPPGEISPEPRALAATELERLGPVIVAGGDGALAHPEPVRRWTGRSPIGPPVGRASAAALLELVWSDPNRFIVPDTARWEPNYGRPAEAQVRWEAHHGRPLPDTRRSPG
jgi:tRNA threonylcarbamoyladenosine biosynthesis protein TsaB